MSASRHRYSIAARWLSFVAALTGVAAPTRAEVRKSPAASIEAADRIREASKHFRAARYAQARALFDAVLAADPTVAERATIAFNAAVSSYALEDYTDALRRFEKLSREAPELCALARVNAGFAALRAGDLETAATYAEPTQPPRAEVETRRQELVAELTQARQARSERVIGELIDAGLGAVSRQEWLAAQDQFLRALTLAGPDHENDLADAHYGLGLVSTELGDAARAEQHFEQSLHYRPGDARTLLALARAAEDRADRRRAERAYEAALKLPLEQRQIEDAERSLFRLYALPATGPSGYLALGAGVDGNATQSGSGDVLASSPSSASSSAYVSGSLDLGWMLRASRRSALGLNYTGDVLALLNRSVDELSLQAHELVARGQWASGPGVRLRLDAGAAYVLTGLQPVRSFEWDGVLTLAADLDTGARSRARLQLSERLVRASELSYLDGHRLQLLGTELWSLDDWELSLQASLRYNSAGTQQIDVAADAYAACSPNCDRRRYQNPIGYWSPGAGAGAAWQATSVLRFSSFARGEYRGYFDPSGIPSVRASRKTRQDWRLRGQLGAELNLDSAGRLRLTLDQTLLVSLSNVAFDANDPAHQYDYGDRNFLQPTTELGVSASLP